MSASLLSLAFKAQAPSHSAKLVLLKLVDCCDDEGRKIFPKVATLADAAQCDSRTVQRHIGTFCRVGLLRRVRAGGTGPGATNHYEMDLDVLRLIAAKGWASVAGNVVAEAGDDDGAEQEPSSHAENAGADGDAEPCKTAKGDTVPPLAEAGRVTLRTDKGDTSATQPLKRIPQEFERERASAAGQGQPDPETAGHARVAGLPGDVEAGSDGEPIPQLDQFVKAWPTSLADSRAKVESAWAGLSIADRRKALAGIAPFLAELKQMRRSHPPAGFTYLSEKRWEQLPAMKAEVSSGEIVSVKPFSRPWWAMFHRARNGQGNARLLLQRAEQGKELSFRRAEVNEAKPEALKPMPAHGEAAQAFLAAARRAGFHFPKFTDDRWLFLPERAGAAQAAEDLQQAGGL